MAKQRKRCAWIFPDELWQRMQPLLPRYQKSKKGGRPRVDLRVVANGIFYVLRTGCQWKAAPCEYGSGSTLHGASFSGSSPVVRDVAKSLSYY